MVEHELQGPIPEALLSVLALSSRFDGHFSAFMNSSVGVIFQYSLCRVVLMVADAIVSAALIIVFQYSLCRVVLMVCMPCPRYLMPTYFQYSLCRVVLMVIIQKSQDYIILAFSTRSVESF